MGELRGLLDREAERFEPSPGALDRTLRRSRRRIRGRRLLAGITALAVAFAGIAGAWLAFRGRPGTVGPAPMRSATLAPTAPSEHASFVLTCSDSVYGALGKGWQSNSIIVGPLALVGLRAYATYPGYARLHGGSGGASVIAVVPEGKVVTVSIPPSEAGRLALLFDPSAFNDQGVYSLSDGEQSVTFRACAPGQSRYYGAKGGTQFAGAFIVADPQCATLNVTPAGEPTSHVTVSFGAGVCPSAAP